MARRSSSTVLSSAAPCRRSGSGESPFSDRRWGPTCLELTGLPWIYHGTGLTSPDRHRSGSVYLGVLALLGFDRRSLSGPARWRSSAGWLCCGPPPPRRGRLPRRGEDPRAFAATPRL